MTTTDDMYLKLLPDGIGEEAFLTTAELQHTMLGQEIIGERIDPNDDRIRREGGLTLKTAGLNVITFSYRNGISVDDHHYFWRLEPIADRS